MNTSICLARENTLSSEIHARMVAELIWTPRISRDGLHMVFLSDIATPSARYTTRNKRNILGTILGVATPKKLSK